jgi:hypothetical protein
MTWLQKENPQITPENSKNKINRKPAAQQAYEQLKHLN